MKTKTKIAALFATGAAAFMSLVALNALGVVNKYLSAMAMGIVFVVVVSRYVQLDETLH